VTAGDPVRSWAELAWPLLERHLPSVERLLAPWQSRRVLIQPCFCDPWHDHILFEGEAVSGLVDYGSFKQDHVAVDLARMLGSLIGDDVDMQEFGLDAYHRVRRLSAEDRQLVKVLDRTGTLIGAANWLRWLYHDGRAFEDRAAVANRLAALVHRLACWPEP
jgi:Ser/Thr protein kinase RdoA (MazF antagonist)